MMSDYATVFSEERSAEGPAAGGGSAAVYTGGSRALHYRCLLLLPTHPSSPSHVYICVAVCDRVKSSRHEVYNIVSDVLNNQLQEWQELPQGLGLGVSWNLLWTWAKPRLNMAHLLVCQRVNHFYDSKQLTRKDLLKKNLQRYTDMIGKVTLPQPNPTPTLPSPQPQVADAFEIMPQTFLLPNEYTQVPPTRPDPTHALTRATVRARLRRPGARQAAGGSAELLDHETGGAVEGSRHRHDQRCRERRLLP